ncbi:hypothetical protein ABZ667_26485 [Streptomyces lavendulae]|uniref:hypothetical protein n=1 Tax=Streptomyces lavendulae TaxID=1914 RepID=UPI0033F0BAAB
MPRLVVRESIRTRSEDSREWVRERLTEVDAFFAEDDGRQIILGLTARPQWRDAVEAGMIAPDAPAAEVALLPLVTDRCMEAPESDG